MRSECTAERESEWRGGAEEDERESVCVRERGREGGREEGGRAGEKQ